MSNLQPQSKVYLLRVTKGLDKGAQFKLVSRTIRIGRGPENDVILSDPKCSRSHAVIHITDNNILIEDLQSQAGVEVDGVKAPKSYLNMGTIIIIGNTHLKFEEFAQKAALPDPLKNLSQIKNLVEKQGQQIISKSSSAKKNNSSLTFYIILAVVILSGLCLFNDSSNKESGPSLLSEEQTDTNIENSKKRQDDLIKAQNISGKNTRQYLEAQATFLKGLRDYREGHYKRALQSFSATLAIYPQHELAQRYYQLAQKRHDELVQYTFNEAQKYLEQNKFKQAQVSFQNVMILVGDANSKIYIEAKEKYNEATLLLNEVN